MLNTCRRCSFSSPFITLVQFQRQLMTSLRTRREPKDNFHPTSEPRTDIAYTIIYLMASYLQDETGAEKASSPTGFTRLSITLFLLSPSVGIECVTTFDVDSDSEWLEDQQQTYFCLYYLPPLSPERKTQNDNPFYSVY